MSEHKTYFKPSRTLRQIREKEDKDERRTQLRNNKRKAKRRDRMRCRFPLCGCHRLKLRVESAHLKHAGMGGDHGARAGDDNLITFCTHRHQFGAVSLHKGTLEVRPKTGLGTNGPVDFYVDVGDGQGLVEVARESAPGVIYPVTGGQLATLKLLAEMEL